MFEREIERYNTLLREYKTTVIDKFNVEDHYCPVKVDK